MINEHVDQAVDLLGGPSQAAKALGVSPSFICQMRDGLKAVPAIRALQFERATAGAVRAVDLCPALVEVAA
ncbi:MULTISPECIES: Cro/CI family transcriptional regulator [unclassified Thioalkalivibrio]|uniref:transcriptional regulator n=1 Tax=unclassified Thioalkalivibrio TaxID=2621013 RepID=UPI0003770E28|nr:MULTISPECIES: Cro/CI family transcriptional regulator [unclassified Thioalkalivibrio]